MRSSPWARNAERVVAAKFNCSPRYVHRRFAGTGRSVGEHVNEQHILVCTRSLLDRTGRRRTIAEIAFVAGFSDVSHFNRLFKRSNGATPREFRRAVTSKATFSSFHAKKSCVVVRD